MEYLKESDAVTSLVPSLDVEGNYLLKKLLMVDPIERITAEEALSHPFLEMYEEMQVLSPLVPIREVYFLRFCQQISQHLWAIVDVSYDFLQEPHSNSQSRARRRPCGCFIENKLEGYLKVTWMEHMEIKDIRPINNLYREQILSGLAFGVARRLATLQRRCERLAHEKNVGKFDIGGVITSSQGKRSLMKFSQKMVDSFGQQVISGMNDTEVRATLQKCNDPGLPNSMVLSAATTIRLPFTPLKFFDFLRDESCRPRWDVLSNIGVVNLKEVSHVVCGYHPENHISVLEALNTSQKKFILQESCIDSSGSLVVLCTLDLPDINKVMSSEDLLFIPVLSLGFATSPDAGERYGAGEILSVGSLVTVVVQTLQSNPKSVKGIKSMLENTARQVKAALNCPS